MIYWQLTVCFGSFQYPGLGSHPLATGSVQDVDGVPEDLKDVFRTAFELDPHDLIDMVAERSPFIDQSQSFSLFVAQPTPEILVSCGVLVSYILFSYSPSRWTWSSMLGRLGSRPVHIMCAVNPLLNRSSME